MAAEVVRTGGAMPPKPLGPQGLGRRTSQAISRTLPVLPTVQTQLGYGLQRNQPALTPQRTGVPTSQPPRA